MIKMIFFGLLLISMNGFSQQINKKALDSTVKSNSETQKIILEKSVENKSKENSSSDKKKEIVKSQTPSLDSFLSGQKNSSPPNNIIENPKLPSAWGPFFFLLFVALFLYYGVKYIKKRLRLFSLANNPIDFIHTIATVPITSHASLSIVEIADKYFLFSITSHNMSLIEEIIDKDLIYRIKIAESEKGQSKNFKELFTSFFNIKVEKKIEPNISETQIQHFIKKQKERLDKLNEK